MQSASRIRKVIVIVVAIAALLLLAFFVGNSKQENSNSNFGETGYIVDREPERFNEGIYLEYEKPGAPALSVPLVFDERSICTFGGQDIQCIALNVTIDTATQGKRAFVTGVRDNDTVLVHTLEIVPLVPESFGLIRSVTQNGVNALVEIDSVEFLSGDAAVAAVMEDFNCARENVSDCAPSMNNDFYIRNSETSTVTYNLTPQTQIKIFKDPGSPVLTETDLATFIQKSKDVNSLITSSPVMFRLDGATITLLEQQYTP